MAKDKKLFTSDQPPVDYDRDVLTAEEIAAVEIEAKAEVEKESKDQAKKALKAKLVREAKKGVGLVEADEPVTIDLAPYCAEIRIDNRVYMQGVTYTVPASKAMVLRETMQNTWRHQAHTDGKSENFYRRTRAPQVIPVGNGAGVVNNSNLLRA
jgi:hypothetical protein